MKKVFVIAITLLLASFACKAQSLTSYQDARCSCKETYVYALYTGALENFPFYKNNTINPNYFTKKCINKLKQECDPFGDGNYDLSNIMLRQEGSCSQFWFNGLEKGTNGWLRIKIAEEYDGSKTITTGAYLLLKVIAVNNRWLIDDYKYIPKN